MFTLDDYHHEERMAEQNALVQAQIITVRSVINKLEYRIRLMSEKYNDGRSMAADDKVVLDDLLAKHAAAKIRMQSLLGQSNVAKADEQPPF